MSAPVVIGAAPPPELVASVGGRSQLRQMARRFRRDKFAMAGLIVVVVLCLAAVGVVVSLFAHKPGDQLGGIFTICCLLYLIAPFSIVRHLTVRREIDTETLLGAIAAYLLIGMFFAFAYKAASEFGSVPFFGSAGPGSLSQDLFFSFVTMTTVGYGNLVPAANPGQTFAVLEAVIGQLFLVVAVGKIISSLPRRGERPGS